jgi:hypothetical protein
MIRTRVKPAVEIDAPITVSERVEIAKHLVGWLTAGAPIPDASYALEACTQVFEMLKGLGFTSITVCKSSVQPDPSKLNIDIALQLPGLMTSFVFMPATFRIMP